MNVLKLKSLRVELGLNQKEFAKVVGIKYDTYQKKEQKGNFTFDEACRIIDVANNGGMNIKLEELRA